MEKEFDYTFKKMYPYVETSVLKQKEVICINNIIATGRLRHFIKFVGYGVCEYDEDDKQLINTHVVMADKFNRLRTNVMVFDVFNNDWTNGVYDKLFIFKTAWPKEQTLNIVFHNTKTGNSMHHPEIEFAYDTLVHDIMKVFNTLHKQEILDFHKKKLEDSRNDKWVNDVRETNIDGIIERYYNAQWDNFDAEEETVADAV